MVAVGIAGRSGSGKTRIAREIDATLEGVGVLSTDAYYRDLSGLVGREREAVNFDAPSAIGWDLLVRHLSSLAASRAIAVPRYDFATHARVAGGERLAPCELLVLEGLFAHWHPRVRAALDLAVFVDAPEALCLSRRIARDTTQRGRTVASVREQWRRDVAPMFREHVLPARDRADLVVDGAAPPRESARAVIRGLARLRSRGRDPSLHSEK